MAHSHEHGKVNNTTIRVYNFRNYSMYIGMGMAIAFLIIGVFAYNLLLILLGGIFLVVFYLGYKKNKEYSLRLEKNMLQERQDGYFKEIHFKEIDSLDCEIVLHHNSGSFTPVFNLIQEDNSKISYKLVNQAALYDIVEWLKTNYPNAELSHSVRKVLNWAKSGTWLFKSS